jgi:hypothetical protein
MNRRTAVLILSLLIPLSLFSKDPERGMKKMQIDRFPSGSILNNRFDVKNISFNRTHDAKGRGEVLRVEFEVSSFVDQPIDLYIFTIAIHEKVDKSISSFERPIPAKDYIKNFVPFPYDLKNFQNSVGQKDSGFVKFPKNPKAGINPSTGKQYRLKDKLFVKTTHLSKYRKDYVFFNTVVILIYDAKKLSTKSGYPMPVFRQVFYISGIRR